MGKGSEISLIEDALTSAANHPVFLGWREDGISDADIMREGGDAAFVTADIAWRLKAALEVLRG